MSRLKQTTRQPFSLLEVSDRKAPKPASRCTTMYYACNGQDNGKSTKYWLCVVPACPARRHVMQVIAVVLGRRHAAQLPVPGPGSRLFKIEACQNMIQIGRRACTSSVLRAHLSQMKARRYIFRNRRAFQPKRANDGFCLQQLETIGPKLYLLKSKAQFLTPMLSRMVIQFNTTGVFSSYH